jgi:hypothetical protein
MANTKGAQDISFEGYADSSCENGLLFRKKPDISQRWIQYINGFDGRTACLNNGHYNSVEQTPIATPPRVRMKSSKELTLNCADSRVPTSVLLPHFPDRRSANQFTISVYSYQSLRLAKRCVNQCLNCWLQESNATGFARCG